MNVARDLIYLTYNLAVVALFVYLMGWHGWSAWWIIAIFGIMKTPG